MLRHNRDNTPFRWLIYALGGGLGHLTRALALARAASRRGHSIRILSNSPFARELTSGSCRRFVDPSPGVTISPIDSRADQETTADHVRQVILAGDFDVLVIDTFPRGLGGELADLFPTIDVPKFLVHRDLNPRYVDRFDLGATAARYDRVFVPGEIGPLSDVPQAVVTAPWLVCDADELLPTDAARQALGIGAADSRRLVVISGCGKPEELDESAALAVELKQHFGANAAVRLAMVSRPASSLATGLHVACWPLLAVLRGVDLLIGAGGYNTVHEARATATSLLALSRKRLYDRQYRRLRGEERVENVAEMIDRAATLLRTVPRREFSPAPCYHNGVHDAVAMIERAVVEKGRNFTPAQSARGGLPRVRGPMR